MSTRGLLGYLIGALLTATPLLPGSRRTWLIFSSALALDRLALARRSELSAVHFGGVGAGIATSAAVVSALMAWGFDWRALWLASGAVALVAVVVVPALVPDSVEPSRPPAATHERVAGVLHSSSPTASSASATSSRRRFS